MVVLAIGLAFLIKWAIDRGTGSLYAGAIITALAVPGVLNAAGIERRRARARSASGSRSCSSPRSARVSGGGWGWQLWFGGLLALIGGVNIVEPDVRRLHRAGRC